MPHRTEPREPHRPRCLNLSGVDRLQPGAEDLRLIAAGVDREGDDSDEQSLGRVLREKDDKERGREEDLDQKRRAANDFNKAVPDSSYDIFRSVPEQRDEQEKHAVNLSHGRIFGSGAALRPYRYDELRE